MLKINGNHLSIEDVVSVARGRKKTALSAQAASRINTSRGWIDDIIQDGKAVYGINTGFGVFSDQPITPDHSARLSRNLILSHAVSTGPDLPEEVVRAAMLIRANTLAKGNSGVRLVVIETLLEMLNRQITPLIPAQGSLGSSGDLSPLAHLALVFTRADDETSTESGRALYRGKIMPGKEAMREAGLSRIVLQSKEGLAITNGAAFSAAIAALAAADSRTLLDISEICLAMSLEALLGVRAAFDPRIQAVRNHPGQIQVAESILKLTEGSTLLDSTPRVQDAYSLRCAPQIHGPARETEQFVRKIINREINAATDNPLLFEPGIALSGGNFHGECIAIASDFLSIAMAEIGAVSERRIFRMTDGNLNGGLPPMLVDSPGQAGLHSGMMMPHYTAASLALENKTLAAPDSIHSLPTSGEQEDHNANAMTAARHTRQIIDNTAHILAVELYTAARALDLRMRDQPEAIPGNGTGMAHRLVRDRVPYRAGDAYWGEEIHKIHELVKDPSLVRIHPSRQE